MIWSKKHKDINPVNDKVFIYKSELEYISKCILDCPNIETGGNLFGFWTHSGNPIIQYVVGPGIKANHEITFFNQDNEHLVQIGKRLIKEHALQHIGEWHSHHKLGLAKPSGHDSLTIIKGMYSASMDKFLLIIGNCNDKVSSMNPFLYTTGSQYSTTTWIVLEGESPIRKEFDIRHPELNYKPQTPVARVSNININSMNEVMSPPQEENTPQMPEWMEKKDNHTELKKIIDYLFRTHSIVQPQIKDKTICINLQEKDSHLQISFPSEFPIKGPDIYMLECNKKILISDDTIWSNTNTIADDFINYYSRFVQNS